MPKVHRAARNQQQHRARRPAGRVRKLFRHARRMVLTALPFIGIAALYAPLAPVIPALWLAFGGGIVAMEAIIPILSWRITLAVHRMQRKGMARRAAEDAAIRERDQGVPAVEAVQQPAVGQHGFAEAHIGHRDAGRSVQPPPPPQRRGLVNRLLRRPPIPGRARTQKVGVNPVPVTQHGPLYIVGQSPNALGQGPGNRHQHSNGFPNGGRAVNLPDQQVA